MGYALPAAIGAHYATGKPVACICGDGAFQMNIQELQWVKRENIPVKIVVMNNEALGMIRHLQRDYFDCVYADTSDGSGFSSCDFSDVAKAYGIRAKRIQGEDVEKVSGSFLGRTGRSFWRSCWKTELMRTRRPVLGSRSTISSLIYRNRFLMN